MSKPLEDLQKSYHRRFQISNLYCQGIPQHIIAEKLNVSVGTVYHDLKFLRKMWINSAVRSFDRRQAEELAKIDNLEREAWDAWQKSKEPLVVEGNGQRVTKTQTGDVSYLRQIAWCVEIRLKMFGLLKPEQKNTNVYINWDSFALGTAAELPEQPVRESLNGQASN